MISRAASFAFVAFGLVASCGGARVDAYPGANEPRVLLGGDGAAFAGPTDSCPLGGPRRIAGALLTNVPETCSALRSKTAREASGLFVYVAVEGTDLPPVGTYRVEGSARACDKGADVGAELVVAAGAGTAPTRRRATAGTITLTAAEASRVAGSFDVALEGGGHARGSFASRVCDVDWTLFGRPRPREPLH